MNYFIQRGIQQYGPYSLADLQRYVQQGNIALTDLARSDGMTDWVPVSQIIGNVSAVPPAPAYGASYGAPSNPYVGASTPYGSPSPYGAGAQQMPIGSVYPPPSLHWGLVLLFCILSCGIFTWVWIFIQAAWVKRVRPNTKALLLYIVGASAYFVGAFMGGFLRALGSPTMSAGAIIQPVLTLGGLVVVIVAHFTMRSDIEDYYNQEEPIGLQLSGVMTFFFNIFYFQYHFTRINEMKRMSALQNPNAFGVR